MQTRAKWLALLVLITLSACGTTRRSAAELDTSRHEPAQTHAPQYPYTWRPRQLPREPACYDAAMCYDEKREVCVLHGGRSWWWDSRNTTWIWDGEKWWSEEGTIQNTYAHSHAMTYRRETEGPIMWGGGLDYPYTMWNQWSPMTECRCDFSPDNLAMASDPVRKVVVAFGGLGTDRKELRTLYEISKDSLKPIAFESGPEAQYNALFIYEPSERACLLVDRLPTVDGDGIRTWTWNGEMWTAHTTSGPESTIRRAQFLIFDTSRQCPVAICPSENYDNYQLWELRGAQWVERKTTNPPVYRQSCSAAYDQKRKTVVVHGGQMHLTQEFARDETWLCDNEGKWKCANSTPAPRPDIIWSCMCYDPSRHVTVMLEEAVEYNSSSRESRYLNEWHWDGLSWKRFSLPAAMPRCCEKLAVFDIRRNQLLVWFEGDKSSQLWKCVNGVWSHEPKGDIETPIRGGVFDERNGVVRLFHSVTTEADDWTGLNRVTTWDGQRLETQTTDGPDPYFESPSFCFDRSRGVTCVFARWEKPDRVGIWEFDGSNWAMRDFRIHPRGWSCESFGYLGATKRSVLFGGGAPMASDQIYVSEHWEWNGSDWCPLQFPNAPAGRSLALIAEDTDRGCLVLFGGVAYRRQYCDTWEYGPDKP